MRAHAALGNRGALKDPLRGLKRSVGEELGVERVRTPEAL